jgi:hypothetical protein
MTNINRWFSPTQRLQRTGLVILFLYFFYNGSPFNFIDGVIWLSGKIMELTGNYQIIAGLVLFAVVVSIVVFAYRRWILAWKQLRTPMLAIMKTLPVIALVVAFAVVISTIFGRSDLSWYILMFEWTWQIPVGWFIGNALSWSVVDRGITGQVTTAEVAHTDDTII